MRLLFLGDVVGDSGCEKITKNLSNQIKENKIDFVIVNGENADVSGVGLTEEICKNFFNCGVNVITTGNHVWDQKDIMKFIDSENRLLRPKNLFEPAPGNGFQVFYYKRRFKVRFKSYGKCFYKKCDDVFKASEKFINNYKLRKDFDFLVDFHGVITC